MTMYQVRKYSNAHDDDKGTRIAVFMFEGDAEIFLDAIKGIDRDNQYTKRPFERVKL